MIDIRDSHTADAARDQVGLDPRVTCQDLRHWTKEEAEEQTKHYQQKQVEQDDVEQRQMPLFKHGASDWFAR